MANIKALLILPLLFISQIYVIEAQPILSQQKKGILVCDFFEIDTFGNIYAVSNFKIQKIDSLGKVIGIFDQGTDGKIQSLDISNPLKILVHYPYRNKIQFLDRSLSPMEPSIDLLAQFSETISNCCTSYSNGLWCYSQSASKLFRINQQAERTSTFEYINQWLPNGFNVAQLIEVGDFVYMGDPNNGIMVFDRWGSLIHKIPNLYQGTFSVVSELIFYFRGNSVYYYNPKNFEEKVLYKTASAIKQCNVLNSKLILLMQNDSIFNYSLN